MPRTTPEAVAAIIGTDTSIVLDDLSGLDPFIEAANAVVDDVCAPLTTNAVRLELTERWLAAHFYAVRDPRVSREFVKILSTTYQSKVGLNLNNTSYGQQAMIVDTTGGLAAWNKAMTKPRRKAGVYWLGVEPSVEEDE